MPAAKGTRSSPRGWRRPTEVAVDFKRPIYNASPYAFAGATVRRKRSDQVAGVTMISRAVTESGTNSPSLDLKTLGRL
jgi:hypothetical protein